jgi:hypothetical protein
LNRAGILSEDAPNSISPWKESYPVEERKGIILNEFTMKRLQQREAIPGLMTASGRFWGFGWSW